MATKLTQAQLLALTKVIGLDVQVVENDSESDYATTKDAADKVTQDTLILSVDTAREPIISQKVLGAKADEIHTSVTKKANHALRKAIAEITGVNVADIDGKEAADALKIGFDSWSKKMGGDKEEFSNQLKTVMEAHKGELTKANSEWETKYNTKVNELSRKEIIDLLIAEHNTAKGLPPTANKAKLAIQFGAHLDSVATVKAENGKIALYQKDKPEMPLLNASGTNIANVSDYIKPFYTDLGIWNEDNRAIPVPQPGQNGNRAEAHTVVTKDGNMMSPLDQQLATFGDDYGRK